jgi:hypothetical protein
MPHTSLRQITEAARTSVDRYVDMQVRWLAQDDSGKVAPGADPLLVVGGRWDRQAKAWTAPAASALELEFHPGQLPAAKWFARWLAAKTRGELLTERGKPVYSVALHGGRRGGKTDLAAKAAVSFAVMRPDSRVWLVSESAPKTQELSDAVREWLPSEWYEFLGAPRFELLLANGSRIWFRSAHNPEDLKRGRCDFAALNEAQQMAEAAFAITRAATADNAGVTVLAMNPWSNPIGAWSETFYEEARAGDRQAIEFAIDAMRNPHVDRGSLEAMRAEVDERTFRREIGGEFLLREDVAFHAWKSSGADGNVRPMPTSGDITRAFTHRHFRQEFDAILGVDFQKNPYPCAVELRAFEDADDPAGALLWSPETTIVERGDEYALSQALLDKGYDPERTALICDASGAHQGIDRKVLIPSFDLLRSYGWNHIYQPDENERRNPLIVERVRATNARMRDANGKRRLFSTPENLELNRAVKLWETRNGVPHRRSIYAHLCDGLSYPVWRFFPRREVKKPNRPPRRSDLIVLPGPVRGIRMF